jgi:hypothetical protein
LAVLLALLLLLSACGSNEAAANPNPAVSPSPTTDVNIAPPGGTSVPATPAPTVAPTPARTSSLFDPSIFVIKASGSAKQELAPGYFANYECEIYLHKIDQNDNRVSTGSYQGTFWMNTTLDTGQFISEMLKDVPVDMTFDAGGEVVSDNFGIYLNTTDDKAWVDYNIPDANGNPRPLTRETPVDRGSFAVVTKAVYLEAHAKGVQGEKVDYSDASAGDQFDLDYVVQVEPDSAESGGTRKVIFYITAPGAVPITAEGTMTRLPGTREDVDEYLNSTEYQSAARKHLEE